MNQSNFTQASHHFHISHSLPSCHVLKTWGTRKITNLSNFFGSLTKSFISSTVGPASYLTVTCCEALDSYQPLTHLIIESPAVTMLSFDFCFVLPVVGVDSSSTDFLELLLHQALGWLADSEVFSHEFSDTSEVETLFYLALFFTSDRSADNLGGLLSWWLWCRSLHKNDTTSNNLFNIISFPEYFMKLHLQYQDSVTGMNNQISYQQPVVASSPYIWYYQHLLFDLIPSINFYYVFNIHSNYTKLIADRLMQVTII